MSDDAPAAQNAAPKISKAALVEQMLRRTGGASIEEIGAATAWQPHSCRAFLTGLRKKGRVIERAQRKDGTTCYRLRGWGKARGMPGSGASATSRDQS